MYLDSAKKAEIFEKYAGSATNTGSSEGQIALLTYRIQHLTDHMRNNHKDYCTNRSYRPMTVRITHFLSI